MKIIFNDYIPLKGFSAMTIFPFIFVRKDANITPVIMNHEKIHGQQQKEMLLLFFYIWYCIEWLVNLLQYRDNEKAYRNISFERESYANQSNVAYLDERKPYYFLKYVRKSV